MSRGRFLNQKLGKRTSRKTRLLKAQIKVQRPSLSSTSKKLSNARKGFCGAECG